MKTEEMIERIRRLENECIGLKAAIIALANGDQEGLVEIANAIAADTQSNNANG